MTKIIVEKFLELKGVSTFVPVSEQQVTVDKQTDEEELNGLLFLVKGG